MKKQKIWAIFFTPIALFMSTQASAYTYLQCRTSSGSVQIMNKEPNTSATVVFASQSIPFQGERFNALVNALNAHNRVPSNFSFQGVIHSAGADQAVANAANDVSKWWIRNDVRGVSARSYNGVNEFFFSGTVESQTQLNPDSRAFTRSIVDTSNCATVEKDVIFNTNPFGGFPWQYNSTATTHIGYGGTNQYIVPTAIHEIGHYLGLDHEGNVYNIMGSDASHVGRNGNTLSPYVGEDAGHGLVTLYGETPYTAKQDVGVTHWEWVSQDPIPTPNTGTGYIGATEGYSNHQRTRLYNTNGTSISTCTLANGTTACNHGLLQADRFYHVKRGQQIRTHFGFENNGLWPTNMDIGYYISTDPTITTSDSLLATVRLNPMYRDTVDYRSHTLTIPTTLSVGQDYYLGVIIDYNKRLQETDETNNVAYVGFRIIP